MSKLLMHSSIKCTAGLMTLSCAVLGVLAEGPRAQDQSCPSHPAPDLIDDFTVLDTALPGAHTRIQDESDIDIKFRWFSDLDPLQAGYYVSYGIRNLATGQNSGLIFRWDGPGLTRPSTSPLRSLGSLTAIQCFEMEPIRRDKPIEYSPSLARDVLAPAYVPQGAIGADAERATWSRVVTDFLHEFGHVVDVFFEIRSRFTSKEVTYSFEVQPANLTIGIGDFSWRLRSESIDTIAETMRKQGFSVEVAHLDKVVDEGVVAELPRSLRHSPLLLMTRVEASVGESVVAEFAVEAAEVSNVTVPVIFLAEGEQAIASVGVSVLSP